MKSAATRSTILNDDLTDDQVFKGLLFTGGWSKMYTTFHGKPERKRLEANQRLYRLVTLVDNAIYRGEWWMSEAAYQQLLDGAGGDRAKFVEIARDHMAIKMAWSSGMRFLIQVRLKQPVIAWVGPARAQRESMAGMKDVRYAGGAEQIWLPNLADPAYKGSSLYASLEHTYSINVA
jgi:hypothetical protein